MKVASLIVILCLLSSHNLHALICDQAFKSERAPVVAVAELKWAVNRVRFHQAIIVSELNWLSQKMGKAWIKARWTKKIEQRQYELVLCNRLITLANELLPLETSSTMATRPAFDDLKNAVLTFALSLASHRYEAATEEHLAELEQQVIELKRSL